MKSVTSNTWNFENVTAHVLTRSDREYYNARCHIY